MSRTFHFNSRLFAVPDVGKGHGLPISIVKAAAAVLRTSAMGLFVFVLVFQFQLTLQGQTSNASPLEVFQQFVTGKIPIEEAVIYRTSSGANGKVTSEAWLRFGYQEEQDEGETWYTEVLTEDPNRPAKLVPLSYPEFQGASYTSLWSINDKNLHVAGKASAYRSVPETYGAYSRDIMLRAHSLGIPCTQLTDIEWTETNFRTRAVTKFGPLNVPLSTNEIRGRLHLGSDNMPSYMEYKGISDFFPDAKITYEHPQQGTGIPIAYTIEYRGTEPFSQSYRFTIIRLGKVDLSETGGYVPTMFASSNRSRTVMLWTNKLAYELRDNRTLPAFKTEKPRDLGGMVMGGVAIFTIFILGLGYHRMKNTKTKQK